MYKYLWHYYTLTSPDQYFSYTVMPPPTSFGWIPPSCVPISMFLWDRNITWPTFQLHSYASTYAIWLNSSQLCTSICDTLSRTSQMSCTTGGVLSRYTVTVSSAIAPMTSVARTVTTNRSPSTHVSPVSQMEILYTALNSPSLILALHKSESDLAQSWFHPSQILLYNPLCWI